VECRGPSTRKARTIAHEQPSRALRMREIVTRLDQYCRLADRVLSQTRRRVLDGEQVPVADKVFSIFEPHTDLIVRGKTNKPVEFGHKVFLAESGVGLVTEYLVLDGNPKDDGHVGNSLESHQRAFGRPPALYAADRGFYSALNVDACRTAGVAVECIPFCGGGRPADRETYEKTKPFKNGQRFRAGIEGRISVLMRGRGMRRCLSTGRSHFEVFVGLAVLANNLLVLAELINAKRRRRKKAA
jgi:IS5 family transposase